MADEHMVEQMSRSRGNRSGRRSFRGATPPPSPKQEISTNQKTNTTDEKDSPAVVFEPVRENSLVVVVEDQSVTSEDDSTITIPHDLENKETINATRKRPPSPNLPVPIATKKPLNDSGNSDEVSIEDESKLVNSKMFGNKPLGVVAIGQMQHVQVSGRTQSMPPPVLGKLESSASKVLTEEFQKQLGQENSKLRSLIIKEVRRPGKSEFTSCAVLT